MGRKPSRSLRTRERCPASGRPHRDGPASPSANVVPWASSCNLHMAESAINRPTDSDGMPVDRDPRPYA